MTDSDWETLFWTVFGGSDNAMAIVDAQRSVVAANGAAERRFGSDASRHEIDEQCWHVVLARGEGHGVRELTTAGGERVRMSYAAHVAHVGGRLVVLVVLMDEGADEIGPGDMVAPLTPRELEIVSLIAMGATSRSIADELHVTPETVRTHVRNAMAKTGTRTRAHLVAAAICRGLLPAISSS